MEKLVLPLPPSVNYAFTNNKYTGRHIYTAESKNYYQWAWGTILAWKNRNKDFKEFHDYTYMDMDFFLKRRGSDSHNYLKLTCDALEKYGIVCNDTFLLPRIQHVDFDKENPRIEISFKSVQTESPR